MRRRYTREQRSRLLELVTGGDLTVPQAAAQLGVTSSAAYNWVAESRKMGRPRAERRESAPNKTERSHTSEAQLAFGDLLASEQRLQKELDEAVAKAKAEAGVAEQSSGTPGARKKPKGRRNLLASNLPRCLVEILDEELEAKGCRRIGFEDSAQLMFRRGGFAARDGPL